MFVLYCYVFFFPYGWNFKKPQTFKTWTLPNIPSHSLLPSLPDFALSPFFFVYFLLLLGVIFALIDIYEFDGQVTRFLKKK